jgi:hypothetical protein
MLNMNFNTESLRSVEPGIAHLPGGEISGHGCFSMFQNDLFVELESL